MYFYKPSSEFRITQASESVLGESIHMSETNYQGKQQVLVKF
jgi:hypothetical protein